MMKGHDDDVESGMSEFPAPPQPSTSSRSSHYNGSGSGEGKTKASLSSCVVVNCKNHYRVKEDDLMAVSSDSADDESPGDESFKIPTEVSEVRYTSKGKPDKRVSAKKAPPIQVKKVLKEARQTIFDDASESLKEGKPLLSEVVVDALEWLKQPGYAVVDPAKIILWPVFYSGHWILAVVSKASATMFVYDSLRTYAHALHQKALLSVQQCVHKKWKIWLKPQLKHCDQQAPGSNDCRMYVIDWGLQAMGVDRTLTRKALAYRWRTKQATDTLDFLDETASNVKTQHKKMPPKGAGERAKKKRPWIHKKAKVAPVKKTRKRRRKWTHKKSR